ncbi:MAG: extracellular solute-binding protein [Dongiaceae bacterium]
MTKINPDRLLKDLRSNKFDRRTFMQGVAAAGLSTVLIPTAPNLVRADTTITYFTWSGYDLPEMFPEYISKYGTPPTFAIFGEEEEALQKLRGGFTADISHPCTSNVRRWRDAEVITAIDVSRIERWDEIMPALKKPKGVEIDGQNYFMPWDWGNTSLLYRADLVDMTPEDETYAILLDERYAGKMSVFDSAETVAAIAGLLTGAKDPFDQTPEEITATFELWKQIHANLRFYWTDTTQFEQALATGEIVVASAWNESVGKLQAEGVDVRYMVPKEGILTWVCGLAANLNADGDDQEVYDMMNAMLDPEVGKWLIEYYNYGHSNAKSYDIADPEILASMGLTDPVAMIENTVFFDEMPTEMRETINAELERVKAGL